MRFSLVRFFQKSIARQLIFGIAIVHAVLMTMFIADLVTKERQFLHQQELKAATGLVNTLSVNVSSWVLALDYIGIEEIIATQKNYPNLLWVLIIDHSGKVLGYSDRSKVGKYANDPLSLKLLTANSEITILNSNDIIIDLAAPVFAKGQIIGWVRIGLDKTSIAKELQSTTVKGVIYTTFAIAIGILFAWLFSKGLVKDIQKILYATGKVTEGDWDVEVPETRLDELGRLEQDFNQMISSLELQQNQIKQNQIDYQNLGEELLLSEAKYKIIFDTIPHSIIVTLNDGQIIDVNDYHLNDVAFGSTSKEEFIKNNILTHPFIAAAHLSDQMAEVFQGNQIYLKDQYLPKNSSNKPGYFNFRGVPFFSNGVVQGGIFSVENVTSQHQFEAELKQAKEAAEQANHAKSSFLSMMSHELRTPMNGVLGMVQLLYLTDLDQEQKESCDIIYRSGKTLVRLLSDILDLSKIEGGQLTMRPVDFSLNDLIRESCELFSGSAIEKQILLNYEIESTIDPSLFGDPNLLLQVLSNLIGNAIKFTSEGGIKVCASLLEESEKEQVILIEVQDTGIGVKPEFLDKIFDPFTQADDVLTREYGGTGLGLAIVSRLVTLFQGKIWFKSNQGEGSTFFVQIPFIKSQTEQQRPQEGNHIKENTNIDHQHKVKALLAEDDPTNQIVLMKLLTYLNCDIDLAQNGDEAYAMSQNNDYQVVFMDLLMPVMDGLTSAKMILQSPKYINSNLPMIALTAKTSDLDRKECFQAGFAEYIYKPVDFIQLQKALKKYFPSQ